MDGRIERASSVSDRDSWLPPSGPAVGSLPSAWAQPGQNGTGQSGPSFPAPQQPSGWTPPPKPGLLPLRPLGFGTLLGAPFQAIRRNPAPTFGSGLIVQLALGLITVALLVPYMIWLTDRMSRAAVADIDTIAFGGIGTMLLLMLVPLAISVAGSALLQGIMVVEVASATLGERLRLGALWKRGAKRLGRLIGWVLLASFAVLIPALIVVAIAIAISLISPIAIVIAVLVAGLLALGLVVLFAWLGTKLSLTPSAIVLEDLTIRAAMKRSWQLTNGHFWRIFGVLILVNAIVNIAAQLVSAPFQLIGPMVMSIIDPTGTGSGFAIYIGIMVVGLALTMVVSAVGTVALSALVAIIYIDQRMRTEGLDIELQRYLETPVEQRADLPDPYRRA